ncbi:DUF3408 domain-containing protein [Chryseobacterium sp. ISL-6]|uniref:DUF3408 domain-containing protein n=1 Tax=Chryseobacterium sp. ISL-6 TaxID=2819143 RepID=UPI001BEB32D1|nr:DUF3408 domain-containing protein [Chryseobacterium sp. ISL-6]MBT2623733.1 DUF3408 domain-containing protein [Chryseobacterium sp. ISL-6]
MNKDNRTNSNPDVDEEYLMKVMAEGTRDPDVHEADKDPLFIEEKPRIREKARIKKASGNNYGKQFLVAHSMNRRGDKSIYIRQEYHERLSRIVQVIGEDKIPLYAYLDNILEHHFYLFEKAITDDFNEKFKPLF